MCVAAAAAAAADDDDDEDDHYDDTYDDNDLLNPCIRYTVVLYVYSGRENPFWLIDEENPLYDDISSLLNEDPDTPLDDDLGYVGFVIEATNAMGQKAWKTIGRHTNLNLESILLSSCPETEGLSWEVLNEVNAGISGQYRTRNEDNNSQMNIKDNLYRKKRNSERNSERNSDVCSTQYNPAKWNNKWEVRRNNNCYNYATNRITYTFAQPGRKSGQMYKDLTKSEVYEASIRDGLTRLSGPNAGNECLVALVIWPGQDYHFLREDKLNNGYWSQKNGQGYARNFDDKGDKITNPEKADRGPYTVFAGYLGVGTDVEII